MFSKFHTAFLHDLYGVRSSLSARRRAEIADLSTRYREITPRPLGRAVNIAVDLPDEFVTGSGFGLGSAKRRKEKKMSQRTRTTELIEESDLEPSTINAYAQSSSSPNHRFHPMPPTMASSPQSSPSTSPHATRVHAHYATPPSRLTRPTTATPRSATFSPSGVTPSPHRPNRLHLSSPSPSPSHDPIPPPFPFAFSPTSAWTTPQRPNTAPRRTRNDSMHLIQSAPTHRPRAEFQTWSRRLDDEDHFAQSEQSPAHFSNITPHLPSASPKPLDTHPSYPPSDKIYIVKGKPAAPSLSTLMTHSTPPSTLSTLHPAPYPPSTTSVAAAAAAANPNGFSPLRQLILAQPRTTPKAASSTDSNSLATDTSRSSTPVVASSTTAMLSPSLDTNHSSLSSPSPTSYLIPGGKFHLIPHGSIDLTDPFVYQAHAIMCSLLPPSAVPNAYTYIPHLPLDVVLSASDGSNGKVTHSGPPASRLIDLHLSLEAMQELSHQFAGLPCLILGRKMESFAQCGVKIDSLQVGSNTPFPNQTQARTRERLLKFLREITRQHRQELWEEIAHLPRLVLWYIHYDQAAEIVVRLAELGVKASIVHMTNENDSNKSASTAATASSLTTTTVTTIPAHLTIQPRRTFTWYSLHISSLASYSLPILQLLTKILRAKGTPNFLFDLTPDEKDEKQWLANRVSMIKAAEGHHHIVPSHPTPSPADWIRPEATLPGTLVPPTSASSSHRRNTSNAGGSSSATGLTPQQLNNLPPRKQKTALRKEILLILNQKAFMQAKKEQLLVDKHKMELVQLAYESELKQLDSRSVNHAQRIESESLALAERIRLAEERKMREEALIATEKEILAGRESDALKKETSLAQTQQVMNQHFQQLENEKVDLLNELDMVENELRLLSVDRRALMDGEEKLQAGRAADEVERGRMRTKQLELDDAAERATNEKARLEAEAKKLEEEFRKHEESQRQLAQDREAIQIERSKIADSYKELEASKANAKQLFQQHKEALQKEAELIREQDERTKASIIEEQKALSKKIADLQTIENQIIMSKNFDVEIEKLELERREVADARTTLEQDRQRMDEEFIAERQRMDEKLMAERQRMADQLQREVDERAAMMEERVKELQAKEEELQREHEERMNAVKLKESELNAQEEQRLLDWEKKLQDEKTQREFEEKERLEKLAAERAEKFKQRRQSKMEGKRRGGGGSE